MIKLCVSFSSQEEKDKLLRDMKDLKLLKVNQWPKKEYPGKGKSPYSKIYLELSNK